MKLICVAVLGILFNSTGNAANYIEPRDSIPAIISLDKVNVMDEYGKQSKISATLEALDVRELHGGQAYILKSSSGPIGTIDDSSFASSDNKLIIPKLVSTNTLSYNLTLLKTNTDSAGRMQFTVIALSLSSQVPGAETKVVFIEGPKGDKGDKGEPGTNNPSNPGQPPNQPTPTPSPSPQPIVNIPGSSKPCPTTPPPVDGNGLVQPGNGWQVDPNTNKCLDLATDKNNCGKLAHQCSSRTVCTYGKCTGF